MRMEIRDVVAREILIAAALVVAATVLAVVLNQFGYLADVPRLALMLCALRWVLWAGLYAAARPEQHPYLRHLSTCTALGLILIDLLILVQGFRSGGPTVAHWLVAVPLGSLAIYLLQRNARRARSTSAT